MLKIILPSKMRYVGWIGFRFVKTNKRFLNVSATRIDSSV